MAQNVLRAGQTETHPQQEGRQRSYEWNEWELRRKALKLVLDLGGGGEGCGWGVGGLKLVLDLVCLCVFM